MYLLLCLPYQILNYEIPIQDSDAISIILCDNREYETLTKQYGRKGE